VTNKPTISMNSTRSGSEPERSEGSLERVVRPQQRPKLKLREKYGWPVEFIKGRPITNIIRAILHTNIRMTWKHRNLPD